MAWNNFSPEAAWKARVFETLEAFVTHCANLGKTVHQIFETLDNGGLGMHPISAYKDSLHVVDLGVGMHACGNVLHLLCFDNMLPDNPATNMEKLWNDIDKLYHERDTSSQFPHLSCRSFCDPETPHADYLLLKGKGARNRHLAPILASIWKRHMRHQNGNDRHVERLPDKLGAF